MESHSGEIDDDFFEQLWPTLLIPFCFAILLACCCFCCPCCPWYKRRHQGTVYQNITRPPGTTIEVISSQNPTGYPITQQVNIVPQPIAYPAQQMAYPPQQGVYPSQQSVYPPQQGVYVPPQGVYPPQPVCLPAQPTTAMPPTGAAYHMPGPYPEHNVQPNIPPYGQPPPYNEIANAPPASAPRVEEAYAKQAPFNPNYSGN